MYTGLLHLWCCYTNIKIQALMSSKPDTLWWESYGLTTLLLIPSEGKYLQNFSFRHLWYMNLFLNSIPHHSEAYLRYNCHNSIKGIFLQKIAAYISPVFIFLMTYYYGHPVRFNMFWNLQKRPVFSDYFPFLWLWWVVGMKIHTSDLMQFECT